MAWCEAVSAKRRAAVRDSSSRVEAAASDHDLATEVLAACLAGHQAFLESEAEAGIASRHPVRAARALMILGFGNQSPVADAKLERFRNRKGLVGQAAKAARFAYERNNWSRIWYERLVETDDVVDFWRYATLLAKIADARMLLWSSTPLENSLLDRFGWSLEKPLRRRIEAWRKKRGDKLFGGDRPRRIYFNHSGDATLNGID